MRSHSSHVDGPSLAITPVADLVWVGHQASSDANVPLVDPQLALQALDGVAANTTINIQYRGTCWISLGHHGQHQRPGTWSSSCLY